MRLPIVATCLPITAFLLIGVGASRAGELSVRILLSGEVAPGVYGQVQIGNERPPPLVYAQPMVIVAQDAPPPPIYLHVPPGHAKHWRKYCREYNACNRPVFFVRSAEYEPGYEHRNDDDYDRSRRDEHRDEDRDEHRDERHSDKHSHKHDDQGQ